jgi:hypothetical protein
MAGGKRAHGAIETPGRREHGSDQHLGHGKAHAFAGDPSPPRSLSSIAGSVDGDGRRNDRASRTGLGDR